MRFLVSTLLALALTNGWSADIAFKKEGKGPSVVFIHGFGGNRAAWAEQVTRMKKDHTVLSIDLPGHGDSPAPPVKESGAADLDAIAREIGALIKKQKMAPAVVVGHSLGGSIAARVALMEPDAVRGLVIVDSQFSQLPQDFTDFIAKGLITDTGGSLRSFFEPLASGPAQVDRAMKEARKVPAQVLSAYMQAMGKDPFLDRGSAIKVTVALFASTLLISDPSQEKAALQQLGFAGIPKLQVFYFVNAKHWIMWDEPDTFEVLYNDFETNLSATK